MRNTVLAQTDDEYDGFKPLQRRIDGVNILRIPKQELRDKIGFVPQKAFLFSGTILDNFRRGKKDATMEEIRHAAKVAQIDDFIDGLEDG